MDLGMIGLGRMGANMAARLQAGGHEVVVWDLNEEALSVAADAGAERATSLETLVTALHAPRTVWLMVPSGEPTLAPMATPASSLMTLVIGAFRRTSVPCSRTTRMRWPV